MLLENSSSASLSFWFLFASFLANFCSMITNFSAEFESLYTNIPLNKSIDIIIQIILFPFCFLPFLASNVLAVLVVRPLVAVKVINEILVGQLVKVVHHKWFLYGFIFLLLAFILFISISSEFI